MGRGASEAEPGDEGGPSRRESADRASGESVWSALDDAVDALAGGHVRRVRGALDRADAARPPDDAALRRAVRAVRARLSAHVGSEDEAFAMAAPLVEEATGEADAWSAGHALAVLATLSTHEGDLERAVSRWDDALRRLGILSSRPAMRSEAHVALQAAEALLDRGGPSDVSAAADYLRRGRDRVEEHEVTELRPWVTMLSARARAEGNEAPHALAELEDVADTAHREGQAELEWRARLAAADVHAARGGQEAARRQELAATEALETLITALPPAMRESFWNDPRRRRLRRRPKRERARSEPEPGADRGDDGDPQGGLDNRVLRLLEILKRLVSEHDVERLLERITDSAVELSGAERGFVLLLDDQGHLEPRLVRQAATSTDDPSVAFSRSIAEAVLIDGEPLVTVDAREDQRLSDYLSVHKLMLKSVACVPIRGEGGAVGCLYLEHRTRRGRFPERDLDLLRALADQAAIALENARLIAENERRRAELEEANRQLEDAKAQVEHVLHARTAELESTRRELDRTRDELRASYERHGLVGRSAAMRKLYAAIDRVRETDVPIVVQGESGTGKELVARAIHYGGPRANGAFVAVNCAAIPEPLLESELFGHVRGAFTGATHTRPGVLQQASGGTLFLDEVGDMPAAMQVKLLRVLQDGCVRRVGGAEDEQLDVRIVAASNRPLGDLVSQGAFREDLYYRLNVVELRLPPLRERVDDLPLLCEHLLRRIAEHEGVRRKRMSREALTRLAAHPMPGNVRQLEHVLLNACVMGAGDTIEAADLALDGAGSVPAVEAHGPDGASPTHGDVAWDARDDSASSVPASSDEPDVASAGERASGSEPPEEFRQTERARIVAALEAHGWNRMAAAKALGMARRTFYRRLREFEIL